MLPCASRQKFFNAPAGPLPTWMSATSTVAGFHRLSLERAAAAASSVGAISSEGSAPLTAPLRHTVKTTASATIHRGIRLICAPRLDTSRAGTNRNNLTPPGTVLHSLPTESRLFSSENLIMRAADAQRLPQVID